MYMRMFKMLLTFALGLLALQSPQVASAQNTPYEGTTPEEAAQAIAGSDENTIYLYNVGHQKWLSRGGTWGDGSRTVRHSHGIYGLKIKRNRGLQ